jgi:hypothetical protein
LGKPCASYSIESRAPAGCQAARNIVTVCKTFHFFIVRPDLAPLSHRELIRAGPPLLLPVINLASEKEQGISGFHSKDD